MSVVLMMVQLVVLVAKKVLQWHWSTCPNTSIGRAVYERRREKAEFARSWKRAKNRGSATSRRGYEVFCFSCFGWRRRQGTRW
uniref:Putative secreted peptide n=1 Tax=Anopheles braziliensis TaxID=58242 RepID=A0A2M3ZR32_9DIPT